MAKNESSRLEKLKAGKEAFERFLKENTFSFGIRHDAIMWYDHEIRCAENEEKWQKELEREEASSYEG